MHTVHHSNPDARLDTFLDIAQAVKWKERYRDRAKRVEIPEYFPYPYLDRFVDAFSLNAVKKIGGYAEEIVVDRMGGRYRPPSDYTDQELYDLFYPNGPRYTYPEGPKHKKGDEYTQAEIVRLLLTDPHSPALESDQNGVQAILRNNVSRYRETSHLFRDMPELIPEHLRNADDTIDRNRNFQDYAIGVLVPSAYALLARRKFSKPEDYATALAIGAAIFGVRMGFHIAGGNITNSLGHAGEMTSERFIKAMFGEKYELVIHPTKGTISTNLVDGGLLGWLINVITYSEVGNQFGHHETPWKIAYTSKEGLAACIEDPWGMLLTELARNQNFPFLSEGQGFEESKPRPDMPNPGVALIELHRAEQLKTLKPNHQALKAPSRPSSVRFLDQLLPARKA